MKRIIIMSIIAAMLAGCGGASPIDRSVSQVEKALEKVEKNKGKMTEDDWIILNKELEEPLKVISDALESNKVGLVTKMKMVALATRWAAALTEAGISEIERQTGIHRENWETELENAAKELEKTASEMEKISDEATKTAASSATEN